MPTTEMPELGNTQQLVDSGMCSDIKAAEAFLAELGVRVVRGVFARSALLRALDGSLMTGHNGATSGKYKYDAATTLREGLGRFGLQLLAFTPGRTRLARISAVDEVRMVEPEAADEMLVIKPGVSVQARVYTAGATRTGQSSFLVGGFMVDEESPLYLLVSPTAGRFWIALRGDLRAYDESLRAAGVGRRGRRRNDGYAGFSSHADRPGYLRISIPLGGLPALEPHLRLVDEHRMLFPHRTDWIGGRPQ